MQNIFILLLVHLVLVLGDHVIVRTTSGSIRGEVRELDGKPFTSFLGVPYAAPPVGELRFQPPRRHEGWGDSIRDALEYGPNCPQQAGVKWDDPAFPSRLFTDDQDEDCLSLNIYVPGDMSRDVTASLPVIVLIHGGGFGIGSYRWELGDAFVTLGEPVVMVNIQYRLNILGFLTSGDDVLSGNYGLKDQNFALRWVQENIAEFGGDPGRVTICGESAGGESILAHMVSPMSAGLFQKASSQSPPSAWLYPTKDRLRKHFEEYVKLMDCDGNSVEAVQCLRGKPWQNVVNTTKFGQLFTQRVIDGEFMVNEQRHLWANGKYTDVDFMVGFTSDDGKLAIDYLIAPGFDFATNRSRDLECMDGIADFLFTLLLGDEKDYRFGNVRRYGKRLENRDDLYTMLKARYYDTAPDQISKGRGILDCARDGFFTAFSLWTANQVAKNKGNVYVYEFDHTTELLGLDNPGGVPLGAPHASEMPYQFGYGITDSDTIKMTDDELLLTRSMIQAWTSFAVGENKIFCGSRNPSYLTMEGEKIDWPKYSLDDPQILTFDVKMSPESTHSGEKWQQMADFWLALDSLADWTDAEDQSENSPKAEKEEL